ncbi:hypothetical protein D6833_08565 [Candidatus Parcubacteria bacterium]|nr:MAG: hypothetical protein D6833_08565 [Candidatus Parcubacteria bacterium]
MRALGAVFHNVVGGDVADFHLLEEFIEAVDGAKITHSASLMGTGVIVEIAFGQLVRQSWRGR